MRRAAAVMVVLALTSALVDPIVQPDDHHAHAQAPPPRLLYEAGATDSAPSVATMEGDGSDARLLTEPTGSLLRPHASPDGSWIAYSRLSAQTAHLHALPAVGGTEQLLVRDSIAPSWAPVGMRLAYITAAGATRSIGIIDVAEVDGRLVAGEPRLIPVTGIPSRLVWAPDGEHMVFTVAVDGQWDDQALWVASADGELRQLSQGLSLGGGGQATYAWSPDGSWIAFLAAREPRAAETFTYLIRPDGSEQRRLSTQTCQREEALAWEPYGRFLAVVTNCAEPISLITPEGKVLRRIGGAVDATLAPYDFLFAADGRSVYSSAYVRVDSGQSTRRLQQIAVDGSSHRTIAPVHEPTGMWLQVLGAPAPDPAGMPPMPAEPEPEPTPRPDPDGPPPMPARSELYHACPRDRVPPTEYRDVPADTMARLHVDCAAWWRFMSGVSRSRFAPAGAITRGQLASALVRVLQYSGWYSEADRDYFDDDDGSVHEANINNLRSAGVVRGVGRRFDPDAPVRRDQMASFTVAAYELMMQRPLEEAAQDHFADDEGNIHEGNINRGAEADLFDGVSHDRYDPSGGQRRDGVADIGARLHDARLAEGGSPPGYGEAFITRVVDGDTFIADMYRNNGQLVRDVRVRMAGVNAPEQHDCGGVEAKDRLQRGIQRRRVRLSAKHESSVGRDDRPIRFVHVYIGHWLDISQEMLRLGLALWMPHRAEPERQEAFNRTAQRAAAQQVGIWDPRSCGYGPQQQADLRVRVRWDAPGRDAANVNGEVVRIRNAGRTPVALGGWSVRDSSAHPPYRFAAGTTVPAGATLKVHVGSGTDRRLRKFWGARRPLFENASVDGSRGDGAYLLDPDGDIRSFNIYPCLVDC